MQICGAQSYAKILFKLNCLRAGTCEQITHCLIQCPDGVPDSNQQLARGMGQCQCTLHVYTGLWVIPDGCQGWKVCELHSVTPCAWPVVVWGLCRSRHSHSVLATSAPAWKRLLQCWDPELKIKEQEDKRNRNRCISPSFKAFTEHCWIYALLAKLSYFLIIALVHLSAGLSKSPLGRSKAVLARQAEIQNTSRTECKKKFSKRKI